MVIDGKKIAGDILEDLKKQVALLPFVPKFCDILVGDDPVSTQYVNLKSNLAEKVGIKFRKAHYPENITTLELCQEIAKINIEENLCGLIVQLPLPKSLNKTEILNAVAPELDVDCTGEINSNKFYSGNANFIFPTAGAVMEVLNSLNINLAEQKFLILGKGQLVGSPVEYLLKQKGFNVTSVDKNNLDIENLLKTSDIIISATGRAKSITGAMLKQGCVVIDAGASESDGSIVGDIDFDSVSKVASVLSPVPGGVGPVTVAKLLSNVLKVAKSH
jgi:methylenetetrahydrofolate dehydrogenase (NADP+) / methenyltetrahydrofolate cyclohydrolase